MLAIVDKRRETKALPKAVYGDYYFFKKREPFTNSSPKSNPLRKSRICFFLKVNNLPRPIQKEGRTANSILVTEKEASLP